MPTTIDLSPSRFVARMSELGLQRAWFLCDPDVADPQASHSALDDIAHYLKHDSPDYRRHEAIFLEVGAETGALFGAFLHKTLRGQAQGGLRHWPYANLEAFLRDGLRLAVGMGRKCALAGLWWGGGKGLIAQQPGEAWRSQEYRSRLYREYGEFVSSLNGCYVTAEDAGTSPSDIASVASRTRFATCLPAAMGGAGNPSPMTAEGVIRAIEAALSHRGMGGIAGKRFAMQGAGNVGAAMIGGLLERGAAHIIATELSSGRRAALREHFEGQPLQLEAAASGDNCVLAEPCDVLVPNALGGVFNPKTIPGIQASIVCGSANNMLEEENRDGAALALRGITCVPDYIANRMGIVWCCDEHAGHLSDDPIIANQLSGTGPASIYGDVLRVLEQADRDGRPPIEAANALADQASNEVHPIHGSRTRRIVASLIDSSWDRAPA